MKKLKGIFLFVTIISFVTVFVSCSKKETPAKENQNEAVGVEVEAKAPKINLNKELKSVKSVDLGDPDKVLARVNGTEVFNNDIQEKFAKAWKSYLKDYSRAALKNLSKEELLERLSQTRTSAINYLVNLKVSNLMYDFFLSDKNIEISEEELQENIENQIDQILFYSSNLKDREDLFKNVEENQLLTKKEFFEDIARNIKIMAYFVTIIPNNVKEKVEATLETLYTESPNYSRPKLIDLSAIVINYSSEEEENSTGKKVRDQDAAFALAEKIVAQLAEGANFDKLAKKYSDAWNKETKAVYQKNFDGEGLSFLQPSEIEIVKALGKGETTGILENRGGLQLLIFKADNVVEGEAFPFEKVKFQMLVSEVARTEEGQRAKEKIDEELRAIEVVQGVELELEGIENAEGIEEAEKE